MRKGLHTSGLVVSIKEKYQGFALFHAIVYGSLKYNKFRTAYLSRMNVRFQKKQKESLLQIPASAVD